ncbi:CAP domain-containing protein [Hyalangium sp.]|uniref:CAP domain-containing protein n=1 Tax=Hyalangium sp. TaxID=2028555 RepID=UPI002D4BA306|nr:CAP domain-containing protein [Hyalangium sp.]HYI02601.1 CAP domain-containing protein [Hyalangium sp.]
MRLLPPLLSLTLLCAAPLFLVGCDFGDEDLQQQPDGGTSPDGGSTDSPFAREMISAHNSVRISATPTPNPALPVLTWSNAAAEKAQAWADQCKWGHNPQLGNFGENIAAATPNSLTTAGVVQNWASEASFYNYGTNSCAPGRQCGHYTQIVWRTTTQVGCAMKRCTQNSPLGSSTTWDFWVCDYSPPGNFAGQRPY